MLLLGWLLLSLTLTSHFFFFFFSLYSSLFSFLYLKSGTSDQIAALFLNLRSWSSGLILLLHPMASEAVIPEQTTPEVQNMVNDEIKTVELEVVPITKENGEDVVEGKSKNEELASPEATTVVSAEKTEDKEIDPPAVVAIEKIDNVPVLDVEIDAPKAIEDASAAPDVSVVSVPLVESVEKQPEEQLKISDAPVAEVESVDDKLVQEVLLTPEPEEVPVTVAEVEAPLIPKPEQVPAPVAEVEAVDIPVKEVPLTPKPEEVPAPVAEVEAVDIPVKEVPLTPKPEEVPAHLAEVEAVDIPVKEVPLTPKPEEVPVPVAEVEAVDKQIEEILPTVEPEEVPVSESKIVEKSDVVEVDGKSPEESELTTEVETKPELIEPQESLADEIAKNAEVLVTESPVEKQTVKDEEVTVTPDVVESVDVEDTKKEPTPVDVVETFESLVKEAVIEEKKEEVGESKELESVKSENISGSISETGVTEKSSDREKTSIDDEEKKEETVEDVAKTSIETSKDAVDTTTTIVAAAANEPVGEPKELVLEAKTKDTIETGVEKLETAAEVVEEIAKSDAPNLESSKDVVEAKTEGDLPKQEVPAKTTPKHSNNIMSKVKQSIVKVKKAIIGKSPSSKTITSDAKDDIQVK